MSETGTGQVLEPRYGAYVAIDWADQKHYWRLVAAGTTRYQEGELEHTPEALEEWVITLCQRFPGQKIAVAVEQKRGALVYALSKYGQRVLYPVHPYTLSKFRAALYPSGKKDDPQDTALLLELLVKHREQLRPLQPDTEQTRKLQILVEERRTTVDEKTQLSNRLTAPLKQGFPQALRWFGGAGSVLLNEVLQRWPTLQDLRLARPAKLRVLLQEHRWKDEQITAWLTTLQEAVPLTDDGAIVSSGRLRIRQLAEQILLVNEPIRQLEEEIGSTSRAHPDYAIFASLPGAGEALEPPLLVAFGTDRKRFESALDVQCTTGIAPITKQSGHTELICFRRACPKFLRQTFHEWAGQTIRFCDWAKAYYDRQIENGKEHHAAVRSLAFKWIRIVYRCWKDRVPDDDARYVARLQQRDPALWKSCGGFSKFHGLSA